MKLVRYGAPGREKPGMIDKEGRIRDLSKVVPDISGAALSPAGLNKLRKLKPEKLPLVKGKPRIGACVGGVGNFIAIGLNYSDHAAEAGMQIPKEPIIFNKAPSCICGPNDDTVVPKDSTKLDWEVELGIVIGQRARYPSKDKALDVLAGYTCGNEGSIREFQRHTTQWHMGKNFDNTGAIGPWVVTADELPPGCETLRMQGRFNGEVVQNTLLSDMIFNVRALVSMLSESMTLEPGDVIITGTPSGVGLSFKPPKLLKVGDVFEIEIEKIGVLRNPVVAEA